MQLFERARTQAGAQVLLDAAVDSPASMARPCWRATRLRPMASAPRRIDLSRACPTFDSAGLACAVILHGKDRGQVAHGRMGDTMMPLRSRSTEDTDQPPSHEDTEGHRRLFKAGEGTDQPPSDEDTEGHRRLFKAGEDTDQPPSDEAEGN